MIDASPGKGRRPGGTGDRVLRVVSHPVRIEVMRALHNRVASPKELADELGESLSNVSYHFKYLREEGCIEILDTEPRRGAVEHFHQSKPAPEIPGVAFRDLIAEAVRALNADSFDADAERSLSWTPLELDAEGRRELAERQAVWNEELERIKAEAAERLAADGDASPQRVVAGTIAFETPPGPGFTGTSAER